MTARQGAECLHSPEELEELLEKTLPVSLVSDSMLLNSRGYRTTGNQGTRLFSRDTVRDMLQNRFYIGELPNGNGGWIKGKHKPLVPIELFEAAQIARARRKTRPNTIRADARACSLAPAKDQGKSLEKLALFLKDISEAWKEADGQQQNRLAKQLFDIVWIKDKKVLAITPRPEFKPFFDLQYEGLSQGVLHMRPRGDLNP